MPQKVLTLYHNLPREFIFIHLLQSSVHTVTIMCCQGNLSFESTNHSNDLSYFHSALHSCNDSHVAVCGRCLIWFHVCR